MEKGKARLQGESFKPLSTPLAKRDVNDVKHFGSHIGLSKSRSAKTCCHDYPKVKFLGDLIVK